MGYVIPFRLRHVRGLMKPKTSYASKSKFRAESSTSRTKKYMAGMEPLCFHPLTVARLTPVKDETTEVPKASKTSAAVVSIFSYSSQKWKLSSLHNLRIVNSRIATYSRRMARTRKAMAARLMSLKDLLGFDTQKEVAALAGVTEGNWSDLIHGNREISKAAAFRLKDAAGITLDWIYDGDVRGLPYDLAQRLRAKTG